MHVPSGWTSVSVLRFGVAIVLIFFSGAGSSLRMVAQESPAAPSASQTPLPPTEIKKESPSGAPSSQEAQPNGELASQDHPATFKVRVNLVLVRVVVRDNKGQIVPNLK